MVMGERTAYVTHPDCSRHDTGWRHPDHQGRLPAVARAVHADMLVLFDHLLEVEGVPATKDELALAHGAAYIDAVEARCREAAEAATVLPLAGDVVVSGASWDAVRAAVGCVLTAVERVEAGEARNAFCAVRPPGHGAERDAPGAFGIFNGVAVAARERMARANRRVLVVEWGSRAGAGTARILGQETSCRFLSIHLAQSPPLPTGASIVARPLASGAGLPAFLDALRTGMDETLAGFTPDLVLLSLGCDALASDPLGGLGLSPEDYHPLTTVLRQRAEEVCGGRLVTVLEQGYDAAGTARAVVQHLHALASLGTGTT